MSVNTARLRRDDEVNWQATLIGPDAQVVVLVALVISKLIGPDGGQNASVWNGARANVGLSQTGGILWDAEVSPSSVDGLFGAGLSLQVIDVLDLLRVQVEDIVVVVSGSQNVFLNHSLSLILSVV
jgi:hypothetical protein